MRIISGRLGGRIFKSPDNTATHPMAEKVVGAIFNSLGDISGLDILDAYSGSGAIGFESISRGANSVVAIENNIHAQRTILSNSKQLGLEGNHKIIKASLESWMIQFPDEKFDVIICDPPYDAIRLNSIYDLARHLKRNGVFVLSWPGKKEPPEIDRLEQVSYKNFGDSSLIFYK